MLKHLNILKLYIYVYIKCRVFFIHKPYLYNINFDGHNHLHILATFSAKQYLIIMKIRPAVSNNRKPKSIFKVISLFWKYLIWNRNFSCKIRKRRNQSDKTQFPNSNSINTYTFNIKPECKTFIHMCIRKTGSILVNFQVINLGHTQS